MEYVANVEEYASRRKPQVQRLEDSLVRSVKAALRRHQGPNKAWSDALIRRAEKELRAAYRAESGKASARGAGLADALDDFGDRLDVMLDKTKPDEDRLDEQARSIAASLAALILSTATIAAAEDSDEPDLEKVWIDMDDKNVRTAHRGVKPVPLGQKFDVAGVEMAGPGDTTAPIELWINCRCIVGVQSLSAQVAASLVASPPKEGTDVTDVLDLAAEVKDAEIVDLTEEDDFDGTVPWHGVLAPEGVWSGDKRRFTSGSLTNRDLPLPLSWQKTNAEGHDGSVVIGSIDRIWKDDEGLVWGEGRLLDTAEANEYIGVNAAGASRGISVDVDSATMQMVDIVEGTVLEGDDAFAENAGMDVTAGRISGATACAIPAFQEAFIRLGRPDDVSEEALVASGECLPCQYKAGIDEGEFGYTRADYTDAEWADACILRSDDGDDIPIYTPEGRLSRAGVAAAATDPRVLASPDAVLIIEGAREVLGERESVTAAAPNLEDAFTEEFVKTEDGPGWLTHPVDTQRLRRYWTKGKGALKIRWGVPGDFNRCRQQLAKYIKPQYLNGYCANRHYDALGFWPGRPVSAETQDFSGPSLHLVAAGFDVKPPREWFEDPHLAEGSPLVVTEEGRVFGHLAEWSRCHIGFGQDACTLAPESATDYAFFNTGQVLTDGGPVTVGHITYNTGHAGGRLSASAAVAHYDNTGTVIADVHAGRDKFGIWLAGWMRPGTGEEERYMLRASSVSGDWRGIGSGMELVAALAVNVGGFPIPRTEMVAAGGRQVSLVAAGIVPREEDPAKTDEWGFDVDQFAEAVVASMGKMASRKERMQELRVSTGRDPRVRMAALAAKRGE